MISFHPFCLCYYNFSHRIPSQYTHPPLSTVVHLYDLLMSRALTVLSTTERYPLIIMVSPSSSLLDFSDNDEGEHEYQDHHGDYSTRMDELFTDQDEEGSPSHSPRSGSVEVSKATYREQLRDVLGSETTGEDDEADDLDRLPSHGNAFSDDDTRSTSDPQRPVSLTTPPGIHVGVLTTLSTIDNSR